MKTIKYLLIFINVFIVLRIVDLAFIKDIKEENKVYIKNNLRGRILDSKGNILVDNKRVSSLSKSKELNDNELKEYSKLLSSKIEFNNYISEKDIKEYFLLNNKIDIPNKLLNDYKLRYITQDEYEEEIYKLISQDDLKDINKNEVRIFKLLKNSDYLIKSDLTNEELTIINELNLDKLKIIDEYIRIYNYDTSLNQILGFISYIPKEEKDSYLKLGYELNDTVGASYIEKYYENYLKQISTKYIKKDGKEIIIKEGRNGYDLVLNIDINKQLEIDNILKTEIKKAKSYPSSKFYDGSLVVISNPQNGNIIALSGYKYKDDNFLSDTASIINNSYTVGSVVKGASQSVAYKYNAIDKGKKILDSCIKVRGSNNKCSWTRLGYIDDISSLAQSSNYYQFLNAIKVTGKKYYYNMPFNPTLEDFNKYRDMFASYGLGNNTAIDLDNEGLGIKGAKISGDLLLNYSIGQYDTYTPLMLTQYVNTIANNGIRLKLRLASSIIDEYGNNIEINKKEELNKVDISEEDLSLIKRGFISVTNYGTGAGYIDKKLLPAGKTGTSETFVGNNPTNTRTFIAYMPYDNPIYSLSIISPHIMYKNSINKSQYPINVHLSKEITNILFEN